MLLQGTFSGVSGTFTVPSLTGAAGSGVVVEVAIDQMTCGGTFFRAGVQLLVVENAGVNQSQYEGEEPLNCASTTHFIHFFRAQLFTSGAQM